MQSVVILDTLQEQVFEFEMNFRPDNVIIDTNKVLCEITGSIVSVHERNRIQTESMVFPNPIIEGASGTFEFNTQYTGYVSIEIIDQFGRIVKKIYEGYLPEGSHRQQFRTNDLPMGTYLIRCKTSDGGSVGKFSILR
jgi:hypothetical protein